MNDIYLVYEKDANFKVLRCDEANEQLSILISEGWTHIATLSAPEFIKHVFEL